ncbi:kinase-like protein [Westerdykella ornata]|uniref:Kinase-like protein n=1 Tax=Westerdykella ornata TaxID=318751 RepID=A0A6A6JB94_WESOR|nr:kinase-like protein [Westerdykella ornata]KAF2273474.1 kinase-like protein [Westerdykella ornata]
MVIKWIDPDALHQGSEGLAVNNTFRNRLLARIALHTTAKVFKRDPPCVRLTQGKILKTGLDVHLTEAATLKYVAEHTSIPVPKVYCSFLHKKRAYIVMERIRGESLAAAWTKLTQGAREKIFLQLKNMIQELRSLKPPPGTGIQSCVGGSLYDTRLPHGTPRFGPFKSTLEFHHWLRDGLEPSQIGPHVSEEDARDLKAMVARQDRDDWGAPVFTHCDLNPTNIIVRGEQIVAIIDWEFAGWYPAYWEYACAWFGNILRTEWQNTLLSILDPYPEELEMDRTRCKWYGEW